MTKTPPHYHAVRLRAEAGDLLNAWIADYRHCEGIHLTKNQAIIELITYYVTNEKEKET